MAGMLHGLCLPCEHTMYQENQERIRARAKQIWEHEGKPEGRAEAHWEMAREEIAIEDNQSLSLKPNPVAEGKQFADASDEAEPVTAAEEAFGDSGPSAQGEQAPYPYASARASDAATSKKKKPQM
jgi:hypothetical protein